MEPVRPLRDVFAELSASGRPAPGDGGDEDPARVLAEQGHGALPEGLLAEAIVSYADTAPVEVAEHLAPFVVAHSPVPVGPGDGAGQQAPSDDAPSALHGLALLAQAPHPLLDDVDPAGLDGHAVHPIEDPGHHLDTVHGVEARSQVDPGRHVELDFGRGHHAPDAAPDAAPGDAAGPGHHLPLTDEHDLLAVDHDPGQLDVGPEVLAHEGLGHEGLGHVVDDPHGDDAHGEDPHPGHGHLPVEDHLHGG